MSQKYVLGGCVKNMVIINNGVESPEKIKIDHRGLRIYSGLNKNSNDSFTTVYPDPGHYLVTHSEGRINIVNEHFTGREEDFYSETVAMLDNVTYVVVDRLETYNNYLLSVEIVYDAQRCK